LLTGCAEVKSCFEKLTQRVDAARGRSPFGQSVQVVAVTKYLEAAQMQELSAAGLEIFAENRVQVVLPKLDFFSQCAQDVQPKAWHFIGHVQGNKAEKIVGRFDLIHSVDSLKLAKRISALAVSAGVQQRILLQVNISHEQQKFGFEESELLDALPVLKELPSLSLCGLMGMAAIGDGTSVRADFRRLRSLRDRAQRSVPSLVELSMGMSSDFEIAIEEGATLIRVGSLLYKS
jgi:PLP dependent protein